MKRRSIKRRKFFWVIFSLLILLGIVSLFFIFQKDSDPITGKVVVGEQRFLKIWI